MTGRDVASRIEAYNAGRIPWLVERKYAEMRKSAPAFLRGTCHIFYEDWPASSPLNTAPATWISGDLHLENFGAYKAADRSVYFDLNDFDEGVLAPCTWEITRLVTSILVAAGDLDLSKPEAMALGRRCVHAYADALASDAPRPLGQAEAKGAIKDLLKSLRGRDRTRFLDRNTIQGEEGRRIKLDTVNAEDPKAVAVPADQRVRIEAFMKSWASSQPSPSFFQLLDVAQRVAGVGSLGIERYLMLVEGRRSPDQSFLLDLKATHPSALAPYVPLPQPEWASQAHRVVALQERLQAEPPAFLQPVLIDGRPFVLREHQPAQDRVRLSALAGKRRPLEQQITALARATASAHLRSSRPRGPADAENLIAFAGRKEWRRDVLEYAGHYAKRVKEDWLEFCAAGEQRSVPHVG